MWMLSLEWLVLAVAVFWVVGAVKRLKRLRNESKQAWSAVDAQCVQSIECLRHCGRWQALKERVAGAPMEAAWHALLPAADMLEQALSQVRAQPLQGQNMLALERAYTAAQCAWQTDVHKAGAAPETSEEEQLLEWSLRWQQLTTLQSHSIDQFNAAAHDYNRAIAQFPACAIARISGLQPVRTFQKDTAWLMQPSA